MMYGSRTYGYSSQVGEWLGAVTADQATTPAVIVSALEKLANVMESLHRPTRTTLTWSVIDAYGNELEYHELEEVETDSWSAVVARITSLGTNVAIESVFVSLETRVVEPGGESSLPNSAELQLSIDRSAPSGIAVRYALFIDAWLAVTYGEDYVPRDNSQIAGLNARRLEELLRRLKQLVGSSFQVGHSQLYPFAITEYGFEPVRELPPRS